MVLQNGASVEVQSYEDRGDSIRYPRLGGTVTVPKSTVSTIEEAGHLMPPTPPPTVPNVIAPSVPLPPVRHVDRPVPTSRQAPTTQRQAATPNPADQFATDIARVTTRAIAPFILLMLGAAVLDARLLLSRTATRGAELPYRRVYSVLTPAERSLYRVLRQAIDGRFTVFAKVRLADLLELSASTPNWRTYLNKIYRKHADFVFCTPDDLAPLLVIELDDSTHKGFLQQGRDAVKDEALETAGLPILRIPAKRTYALHELCTLIDDHLNGNEEIRMRNAEQFEKTEL